jgi:GNAT superfamily N-acetyltransferase
VADDEQLESGYGPGAPPGDNLCNDFVQESARSFAAFASVRGDRLARLDGIVTMVDAGSPVPFFNRAMLEQPIDDLERVLHELRSFYCSSGGETPFLLDSTWPTPDLRRHGFALMGHPPMMRRPARAPLPSAPPELHIVPVSDDRTAHDYEYTLVYGYPAVQMQPVQHVSILTPAARTAPGWHHFVGYVDDRPVTAGSAYVDDRLVRVDNIATLEDARGRGYGAAITAAAVAVDPLKPATLVASDLGRPVYEHLGFVAMLRVTYWLGTRSALARS